MATDYEDVVYTPEVRVNQYYYEFELWIADNCPSVSVTQSLTGEYINSQTALLYKLFVHKQKEIDQLKSALDVLHHNDLFRRFD